MERNQPLEALESSDAFVSMWRLLASGFDHPELGNEGRLMFAWPDAPLPVYNQIFVTGAIGEAGELSLEVGRAARFLHARKHPGMITVCHDRLSGSALKSLEAIFRQQGFAPIQRITGMAGDVPSGAESASCSGGRAAGEGRLVRAANGRLVTEINCLAYNLPGGLGESSLPRPSLWQAAFPYIQYAEGRPVATATTLVGDGFLYLAMVATVPEARGKGYGEAVVRHSLQQTRKATGIGRSLLHSSVAGRSLYKRLGYHVTARFTSYMPHPE